MFFVEVLAERHKTNWNGGRERIAHLPAEETQSASLKQAQNKNSPRHNIHPVHKINKTATYPFTTILKNKAFSSISKRLEELKEEAEVTALKP